MSITKNGVKFAPRKKRTSFGLGAVAIFELVLSVFLYISLAAHIIWPEQSEGAVGTAKVLSYEGRLTDTSGNPLGSTGTVYCFRFSIYDNATVGLGTKLWPSGVPATTTATVTDGVFSAQIGSADALTFNFYDNDTVYLNVEVNTTTVTCGGTWENLSPRQRIAAAGYAIAASNVYSSILKTDITNNETQIGSGTGVATGQVLLALDVKTNTDTIGAACSPSGSLWYNAGTMNRTLVCDNGTIQKVGNADTIVGIKEASAGSAIASGTAVFSGINGISVSQNAQTLSISGLNAFGVSNIGNTVGNTGQVTGNVVLAGGNNITLSQNGSTITISGGAAGGNTYNTYANAFYKPASASTQALASTFVVFPFMLEDNVSFDYLRLINTVSLASSSFASTANTTFSFNQAVSYRGVLYTKNIGASSLSLASLSTFSAGLTYSLNAAYGSASNTSQYLSMGITYPISTGTSSFSTSYTTQNISTLALSTGNFTRLTGFKFFDIPFAGSLPPGDYWLALNASTASTTQGTNLSGLRLLYSTIGMSQVNNTMAFFGNVNAASLQLQAGVGSFTTAGGASTASMGFSNISSAVSHVVPFMSLLRSNYYQ